MKQTINRKAPYAIIIPTVFALGAFAAIGLRGGADPKIENVPVVQPAPQALATQDAFEKVAEKLRPSVVHITTRKEQNLSNNADDEGSNNPFEFFFRERPQNRQFEFTPRATSSGSGVIMRSDGYILTNDHVVASADKVNVRLQDGRDFNGTVIRDFRSDLAIVKIEAKNLPAASFADSDKTKVGHWAVAFGSPLGNMDTMTVGIISALHRDARIPDRMGMRLYPNLIQTDASINPGNSGGPLVDIYGRVVGINVAIESPTGYSAGIGFAIPSNTAQFVAEQLISKGSVTRGFMGVMPEPLTYDQKQRSGVKAGAFIRSVSDGSPADKAGFQVGDVVIRYDGKPVSDDANFRDLVVRTLPGKSVDVVVRRSGEDKTLRATVGEAPKVSGDEANPIRRRNQSASPALPLGFRVGEIASEELGERFRNRSGIREGVMVTGVVPGSPAVEAGLAVGDIVVKFDGKNVNNMEQFNNATKDLKPGSDHQIIVRRFVDNAYTNILIDIKAER